ncbi:MAG: ABC transporter permease [Pseudonocardiaceae bacterium]
MAFPSTGRGGWSSLVLPSLALALPGCAVVIRLVRGSVIEALGEDYVLAARARGVSEPRVVLHHALRNALVPVTTHLGLAFGALLSGAAIIETVFAWPGVGKLAVDAIVAHDYPVLQGFVLFSAVIYLRWPTRWSCSMPGASWSRARYPPCWTSRQTRTAACSERRS